MTAIDGISGAGPAMPTPRSQRRRILAYLGMLIMLLAFGAPHGGFIDIPLGFLLKNKLGLDADALAAFRLVAAAPLYVSFVFGYLRDSWDILRIRDRGFMIVFGAASALLYALFAFMPLSYGTLLAATILLTVTFLMVSSAQHGLASALAQRHAMSGEVSAAWNILASVPTVAALLLGGILSQALEAHDAERAMRRLFLAGAAVMSVVALYGIWRPRAVFDDAPTGAPPPDLRQAIARLRAHRPIYPALLVWLLWNFAPGSVTPLQYHMQDSLGATDAQWGLWNAIFAASFVPTFIVFGVLCRRVALRTLLWGGTIVAVPQLVPLLFIDSVPSALIAAVPIGLMGGVATAAYLDLIIRACPPGLQGTVLMLSGSAYFMSVRLGDVLGTILYDHFGGFGICVAAITFAYALILPVLLLVPRDLIATPDGKSAA
ncbi:MAG: MFS transporter [Alphaproteobacteria bacterium]|nr:MFS transporter [Alphaproteobacteria bacterium]